MNALTSTNPSQTRKSDHLALVAEDNPGLRGLITEQLRQLGLDVICAHNGTAALELASLHQPTVVVLDNELGDISGLSVCEQLRAHGATSQCFILMLTGDATVDRVSSGGHGADDYLSKPYRGSELIALVQAGIKARARAVLMRRAAKREAIAWLSRVVAHEVNNPLTSASASLDWAKSSASDPAAAGGGEATTGNDLSEALAEVEQALSRIQSFVDRLRSPYHGVGTDLRETSRDRLQGAVREALDAAQLPLRAGECKGPNGVFHVDVALLCTAVSSLASEMVKRRAAAVAVSVYVSRWKAVTVLDFEGDFEDRPSDILNAEIVTHNGGAPMFDGRLSWIEARLDDQGGQLFASARKGGRRYSLAMPVQVEDSPLADLVDEE